MGERMVCKHCGRTALSLILLAMMEEAGAKVYPNSTYCSEAQDHEFTGDKLFPSEVHHE